MKRRAQLATALLSFAAVSLLASTAQGAPCEVELSLEPAEAFVGEQILYRLTIRRRDDVRSLSWAKALTAPGFRVESLATQSRDPVEREGRRYLILEERRALFPVRSGALELPPAALRCSVATEGSEREEEVPVPAGHVRVRELPNDGMPKNFCGLVGNLAVRTWLDPQRLSLGGSIRLRVLVEGRANLWRLRSPLDSGHAALAAFDVLEHPSELARDAGRRLSLRRYFFYDLVPRRTGSHTLPNLAIPYFDPKARGYRVAKATLGTVEVSSPPPAAATTPPADPGRPEPGPAPGTASHPWLWPLGVIGLAGALALAWRLRPSNPWQQALRRVEDVASTSAAGHGADTEQQLAHALRLALLSVLPDARTGSAEELMVASGDRAALREALELLKRLDEARFGSGNPAPDANQVRSAIERLRNSV